MTTIELPELMLLDRDGVILQHVDPYILKPNDIEFVPGSVKAILRIAALNIPIAVVTNQSPIKRKFISTAFVHNTNSFIQGTLGLNDDQIQFYHCPHTAEDDCECRKPKTGMLEAAAKHFNVDRHNTWMVGDHDTDMMAAKSFKCKKRIHVLSGRQDHKSPIATDHFSNLNEAVIQLMQHAKQEIQQVLN